MGAWLEHYFSVFVPLVYWDVFVLVLFGCVVVSAYLLVKLPPQDGDDWGGALTTLSICSTIISFGWAFALPVSVVVGFAFLAYRFFQRCDKWSEDRRRAAREAELDKLRARADVLAQQMESLKDLLYQEWSDKTEQMYRADFDRLADERHDLIKQIRVFNKSNA